MDRELIDRYLAGRLDDAAREQVEARIVADAAFRGEVELTGELREGLHELEARGELGTNGRDERRFWQRPAYAIAASVAAGLLGIALLALYGQLQGARSALAELEATHSLRPTIAGRTRVVTLSRTRSSTGADGVLEAAELPDLLELHLDPGLGATGYFWVTLERVEANRGTTILGVPRLLPNQEGSLVLVVNSGLLQPGDHRVTVTPADGDAAVLVYRVRVRP